MMKKITFLLMLAIVATLAACSDDNDVNKDISVITVDAAKQNAFDKYLNEYFTKPYNIEFLYKWKSIESDMNYALVPASYENSVKMANLVKYLCLEPYDKVAPKGFLAKYFPKMIMMVGSAAYRNNGTFVLGTAEGGLKITLYKINDLDPKNIKSLNRYYFRTIYHEFSHILHQTKDYSSDFKKITATKYTGGAWNEFWTATNKSLNSGFISDYASKEANEDFVELIAHYITNSPESWAKKIGAASTSGQAILNQKMAIVKNYMKDVWKIDLDVLRAEIQTRAAKLKDQNLDDITIK